MQLFTSEWRLPNRMSGDRDLSNLPGTWAGEPPGQTTKEASEDLLPAPSIFWRQTNRLRAGIWVPEAGLLGVP